MQIPNDELDLSKVSGYPLEKVDFAPLLQIDVLHCNVGNYANVLLVKKVTHAKISESYSLFFLLYQCASDFGNYLKLAEIRVYDRDNELLHQQDYTINVFRGGLKVPN